MCLAAGQVDTHGTATRPEGACRQRRTNVSARQQNRPVLWTRSIRGPTVNERDGLKFHQNLAEQMIAEVQSWNESSGANLDELRRLARTAVLPEILASFLAAAAADSRTRIEELLFIV